MSRMKIAPLARRLDARTAARWFEDPPKEFALHWYPTNPHPGVAVAIAGAGWRPTGIVRKDGLALYLRILDDDACHWADHG